MREREEVKSLKAIVLAAGDGTRFKPFTDHNPKPLLPLLGLTLIERILLAAKKAGIRDFVVVLGYKGERVRDFLGDGRRYGIRIEYVENRDWHRGNGTSLLAAESAVKDEEHFVVMMADHVFEPDLLRKALALQPRGRDSVLCVDRDLSGIADLQDATKVHTEGGFIVQIDKRLKHFDAVDTGFFIFSHEIFDALRAADNGHALTLTAGVKRLAERRLIRVVDVTGFFWIDVDRPELLGVAESRLLKTLSKSTDGVVSRWLNRPISTRLTRFLVRTPLSPDTVTAISFMIAVASGILFAVGHLVWAGLLAQFASVIDGVDGEIARLKFRETRLGAFVDSLLDRYGDSAIVLGMSTWAYLSTGNAWTLLLGMAVLAGAPMSMLAKEKFRAITGRDYPIEQAEGWLRYIPDSRDARLFIIMLGGLFGAVIPALVLLAVLTHGKTVWRMYRLAGLLDAPAV